MSSRRGRRNIKGHTGCGQAVVMVQKQTQPTFGCSNCYDTICGTYAQGIDSKGRRIQKPDDKLDPLLKQNFIQRIADKNMTAADVIEITDILSPKSEDIAVLTKKDMLLLVIRNWMDWLQQKLNISIISVPNYKLEENFKNTQPIKLFKVIEYSDDKEDVINKVTNAFHIIGQAGTSSGFECLNYSIPCIYHLIKGARFWIMITQSHNHILEQIACKKYNVPPRIDCLHGRALMMSPKVLTKRQINFDTFVQREGDQIVTVPGTYYSWVNLIEYTQVLCVHYTSERWLTWAKEKEITRCSCKKEYTLNLKKIEANYNRKNEKSESTTKSKNEKLDQNVENIQSAGTTCDTDDESVVEHLHVQMFNTPKPQPVKAGQAEGPSSGPDIRRRCFERNNSKITDEEVLLWYWEVNI